MSKEEVLQCLCYHDPRNPECVIDYDTMQPYPKSDPCYCDNCFRGKTKLAEYILKLLNNEN